MLGRGKQSHHICGRMNLFMMIQHCNSTLKHTTKIISWCLRSHTSTQMPCSLHLTRIEPRHSAFKGLFKFILYSKVCHIANIWIATKLLLQIKTSRTEFGQQMRSRELPAYLFLNCLSNDVILFKFSQFLRNSTHVWRTYGRTDGWTFPFTEMRERI